MSFEKFDQVEDHFDHQTEILISIDVHRGIAVFIKDNVKAPVSAFTGLSEYSDKPVYPNPFVIRNFCPEHLKILMFLRKSFG
jgi:hypothetical protein